jgi:hypothetical protein
MMPPAFDLVRALQIVEPEVEVRSSRIVLCQVQLGPSSGRWIRPVRSAVTVNWPVGGWLSNSIGAIAGDVFLRTYGSRICSTGLPAERHQTEIRRKRGTDYAVHAFIRLHEVAG